MIGLKFDFRQNCIYRDPAMSVNTVSRMLAAFACSLEPGMEAVLVKPAKDPKE
jgi:hypothetical protein